MKNNNTITTHVTKRDGRSEPVRADKITERIAALVGAEDNTRLEVDPFILAQEVISRIKNGIDTKTLDNLAARKAHNKMFEHPDWDVLAARIAVSNYHKETYGCGHIFSEIMREFHKDGKIDDKTWDVIQTYDQELDDAIDYDRDYDTTYLGFKRFENTYAIRLNEKPIERRQDMFMRMAIGIHGYDIDDVMETYEWISCGYFTHATPTLFNAGTPKPQCSSCFLIAMKEEKEKYPYVDSIEKIYETLWDCAKISKAAGGIGLSISNVRPRGSVIRSVGRKGRGVTPMLKVYNETARYVDQGLRRKGAFAIYLEPWHPDIFDFLMLKEPMGQDESRARDLHYAVWIPNLFMERCKTDEMWSLMDPSQCPELINTHSEEFEKYYLKYEKEGKFMRQVKAIEILEAIITSQIHTGQPYVLFKDHCNSKSNQKNLGTIRSSNLCVSGKTRILTDLGYKIIADMKDHNVNVWNGFEWSNVKVTQTGEKQEMMQIEFSNGAVLECTEYHKFYVNTGYYSGSDLDAFKNKSYTNVIEAKDLKIGSKLIKHNLPIIKSGSDNFVESTVPMECNLDIKLKWFAGYVDADGSVSTNGKIHKLLIRNRNCDFLNNIRLMLTTMGIQSDVVVATKSMFTLVIINVGLQKLVDLGFNLYLKEKILLYPQRKIQQHISDRDDTSGFITVTNVKYLSEPQDTYCFKEEKLGLGTFEGIVTGQCAEIVEYSSNDEQAVCNLASLILPKYVEKEIDSKTGLETGKIIFNHEKLHYVTKIVTRNLNKIIDVNFYPTVETKNSNMRHRPIGIGVQGLADAFLELKYTFESEQAKQLNFEIFETMYHAALEASCELAEEDGVYSSYEGSPISKGILQFDMWNTPTKLTDRWNWSGLRLKIKKHGVRNSLLMALMPTASTSQLMGSYECFEPYSQNNGTLSILNGTYKTVNTYMIRDLIEKGLWTKNIQDKVQAAAHGSIQNIEEIPRETRDLYKTVWEIPQKTVIDLAADRGRFVCQSQSMNIYYETPDFGTVATMLMYGYDKGLKTGVYYLRSQPSKSAIKTTVDPTLMKEQKDEMLEELTINDAPINSEVSSSMSQKLLDELNGLDEEVVGKVCNGEPDCLSCQ
jgi:ribonucleoside-diphosphate reductase alpha chain